jgi:hypothetical protein
MNALGLNKEYLVEGLISPDAMQRIFFAAAICVCLKQFVWNGGNLTVRLSFPGNNLLCFAT